MLTAFSVHSQETKRKKFQNTNDDVYADTLRNNSKLITKTQKPTQQINAEILGQGLGLSINYDTRFKPGSTGLGFNIGAGITLGATIPVAINYLIGNNNKRSFLELGAGGTIYFTNNTFHIYEENKIIPITYIMYRYQALKTGNTFRIGLTQLYASEDDFAKRIQILPSLSLGQILGRR
ncbi:hypothetical protein A5893_01075 [Pedobacter psychrophilus]|uniref:Outer membrane protein beta-barrel domain-containing protein n=1 Tax=Pedobacter psychrophilus TaxID=1826909 RepID=A0A179DKU7_9SPHI|nr:hypothetical protein A5893_01075 [Pedobacter psychrophilus]